MKILVIKKKLIRWNDKKNLYNEILIYMWSALKFFPIWFFPRSTACLSRIDEPVLIDMNQTVFLSTFLSRMAVNGWHIFPSLLAMITNSTGQSSIYTFYNLFTEITAMPGTVKPIF